MKSSSGPTPHRNKKHKSPKNMIAIKAKKLKSEMKKPTSIYMLESQYDARGRERYEVTEGLGTLRNA